MVFLTHYLIGVEFILLPFCPGHRVVKLRRPIQEHEKNEDWHSEYQIYDIATKSEVSWTSTQIHRLNTCIIKNQDGEKLSEVLTGLQAAIQVNYGFL